MKILVTGTSTGFGKLIAESLIKEGHDVAATMRGVGGKNRASAEALEKAGAKVVELDVADETSADKGVQDSIEALGGLDVIVNNAGFGWLGLQETFTSEDWKKTFDVNVFGVQRVTRAALPHLRKQGSGPAVQNIHLGTSVGESNTSLAPAISLSEHGDTRAESPFFRVTPVFHAVWIRSRRMPSLPSEVLEAW